MNKHFQKGEKVRNLCSNEIGFITGNTRPFGKGFSYEVDFQTLKLYIKEHDLEAVAEEDMFDNFINGRFNGVLDFRSIITNIRLSRKLTNFFYSMHNSATEFYAHQFKPVIKFLEQPLGRLLIADEVGLGKTIEAIYIWREVLIREGAKCCLVIAPAQLLQKWQNDFKAHFGIEAKICNVKELLDETKLLDGVIKEPRVFITSLQGIRYKKKDDEGDKGGNGNLGATQSKTSAKVLLNDFLDNRPQNAQKLFDLVIIDEAHYLRNSSTASFKTACRVRDNCKYMILLSATPIQTSNENLFNLLSLINPDDFLDKKVFEILLNEGSKVVALGNALRSGSDDDVKDSYYLARAYITDSDFIKKCDTLFNAPTLNMKNRMALFDEVRDMCFYSQYFTRTRKRDVFENRIIREPYTIMYELSEEELAIYGSVTKKLQSQEFQAENDNHIMVFALIARQRQMASCLPAALMHWNEHKVTRDEESEKTVFEDLVTDNFDMNTLGEDDTASVAGASAVTIDISSKIIEKITKSDAKYKELLKCLAELSTECKNKALKVIIFSFYRYTVHYLSERLTHDGYTCVSILGGMGEEKNSTIKKFRDDKNISILLSSEVGSEGIDLQFCDTEINYDLPWNPMRIEQRIGRIDRIGQESKKIKIYNFYCENTIEDKVIFRLHERINMFKSSIGDIEEILGKKVQEISKELFISKLSDEEKYKQAINNLQVKELSILDANKLEDKAGLSAAFNETIMDNIKTADENKRYIQSNELAQFVSDFFAKNYSGCHIEKKSQAQYSITLSSEARLDYKTYVQQNNLYAYKLGHENKAVLCNFDGNDENKFKNKVHEFLDVSHPFIKWIKCCYDNALKKPHPCSAIFVKNAPFLKLESSVYVYYIEQVTTYGIKNTNTLKYYVYNINEGKKLSDTDAERFCTYAISNGIDYCDSIYKLDSQLAITALEIIRQIASEDFERYENNFTKNNEAQYKQQRDYIARTYKRKYDSISETIKTQEERGTKKQIIELNKKRLESEQQKERDLLSALEQKKRCQCNYGDVAVGIINLGE